MAISTPTLRSELGVTAATITSASFTPAAGNILIAAVGAFKNTVVPDTATISDTTGLVWKQIRDTSYDPGANPRMRTTVFWAQVGSSPSSMTVTALSATAANMVLSLTEWDGAVVRATNQTSGTNTAGDPSTTLGAVLASTSANVAIAIAVGSAAFTVTAGYTELSDLNPVAARRLGFAYDITSPGLTCAFTSTNTNSLSVAFELVDGEPAALNSAGVATAAFNSTTDGSFASNGVATANFAGGADLASAGVATADFTGETVIDASMASDGVATFDAEGASITVVEADLASNGVATFAAEGAAFSNADLASDGVGSFAAEGTAVLDASLASNGVGSVAAEGTAVLDASLASDGVGSFAAEGVSITVVEASLASDGVGSVSAVGAATSSASLASDGVGSVSAVGAATSSASLASDGVGSVNAVGAATFSASLASDGIGSVSAVGAATFSASLASDGVGSVSAVSAATAAVSFASAGVGTFDAVAAGSSGALASDGVGSFNAVGSIAIPAPTLHSELGVADATITSASFTPAAKSLLIAAVGAFRNTSLPNQPTISDTAGLTWYEVRDTSHDPGVNPRMRMRVFWAQVGDSPVSMTVTALSTSAANMVLSLTEWERAVAGSPNHTSATDTAGDPAPVLAALAGTSAGVVVVIGVGSSAFTTGGGYTELSDLNPVAARRLCVAYDVTIPGTSPTFTSTNTNSLAVAFELQEGFGGTLASAGVGDAAFAGASFATISATLSADGIGALTAQGASTAQATLDAAGTGSTAFAGSATTIVTAAVTVSGAATASFSGQKLISAALSSDGVGAFTLDAQGIENTAFISGGTGTSTFFGGGGNVIFTDFGAYGVGTTSFISETMDASLASAGVGATSFAGSDILDASMAAAGAATMDGASAQIIQRAATINGTSALNGKGSDILSTFFTVAGEAVFAPQADDFPFVSGIATIHGVATAAFITNMQVAASFLSEGVGLLTSDTVRFTNARMNAAGVGALAGVGRSYNEATGFGIAGRGFLKGISSGIITFQGAQTTQLEGIYSFVTELRGEWDEDGADELRGIYGFTAPALYAEV